MTGKAFDLFDLPLVNEDGSISKLEIFQDITDRKKVDQASRESELFLRETRKIARLEGGWPIPIQIF